MVTTQQLAAAKAYLATCGPVNTLRQRASTQTYRTWQEELRIAETSRLVARTALQDICVTRAAYKEAVVAARDHQLL